MEIVSLKAEVREKTGKEYAKKIRNEGKLPAIIYGEGKESISLIVSKKDIEAILKSEHGANQILELSYGKKKETAIIYEIQHDYLGKEMLHVDFKRISMDKPVDITVRIVLKGEPVGVKVENGFLDFVTREVEISCLPNDIIDEIEVDVSELHAGQSIKLGDIQIDEEKYSLVTPPDTVIVTIEKERGEAKEEEEAEEEAVEEAEGGSKEETPSQEQG